MGLRDFKFFILQLIANRNLIWNLVGRDLRYRYVGSVGGFFWSVIQPVALLICYNFVFAVVFQMRFDQADYGTENFALYLFSGMVPWLMFSDTVLRNCTSVSENSSLVTKTIIPAEVLPIAIMISNLIHHLIGIAILVGVLVMFGTLHWTAFSVLIWIVPLVLLSQGLGWLVSSLNVFLRDTVQVLNVMMVFWLWLTPIFYPASFVPDSFRFLVMLNPMAAIVAGYRSAFLESPPPSLDALLVLAVWTTAAFLGGALFFRRSKTAFADVL
jgi:ABC-type polysaccharide/polyol phosphate export permease